MDEQTAFQPLDHFLMVNHPNLPPFFVSTESTTTSVDLVVLYPETLTVAVLACFSAIRNFESHILLPFYVWAVCSLFFESFRLFNNVRPEIVKQGVCLSCEYFHHHFGYVVIGLFPVSHSIPSSFRNLFA
ncbi:MAG: hypothetical protein IKG72_01955 [Bacillus sp. (in: Bacteria)]|nr:hypothetical protein [Bacillus sp. (in: firmicutes)]